MGTQHLTPNERTIIGKLGAETSWARTTDKTQRTAAARDKVFDQFRDQVDPNRELPPDVRDRLARHAQRAHMLRLSLKAATAARRRREANLTDDG
jgi:hypothetical protein